MSEGTDPNAQRYNGMTLRRGALVRGIVQGVGFRPFVYRLAHEEMLTGFIGNNTDGVTIEIEGKDARVDAFLTRLRSEAPPLARIDSITVRELALAGGSEFRIVSSQVMGQVSTGIPADAATCVDCLRELLDPADRRYRYPFLNCTNCGPRFTITRRIPYDRPQTSMAKFPMCPACQREYDDPLNRRFHAQPNACWDCGPRVWLVRANSALSQCTTSIAPQEVLRQGLTSVGTQEALSQGMTLVVPQRQPNKAGALAPEEFSLTEFHRNAAMSAPSSAQCNQWQSDAIEESVSLLLSGQIMAIKGIGGFHLSVDATNDAAVMRLRERKQRYGKPLAVMVRDLEAARVVCDLTAEEEALLTTTARPIVLARRREGCGIAQNVAPGIPWIGVFLPYAPLQHLLFADSRIRALVMTSANLSEEPIAIDNDEARTRLGKIADAFLMHDREILQRCDDSVAAVVDGAPQLIRRARGFVPLGVPLPFVAPPLLAVGGHLKSVFALSRGGFAYQSQHLGDLENLTGLEFFKESLNHLMRTFEIEPEAVVHDVHPGYLSTEWAKEWARERGLPLIAVQHHHAHIAGCMAELGLTGTVIGLALDGTGYGTDGKVWGGEVLIARLGSFERFAHLDYVPLPGGEKAIKEPWRMALAALRNAGLDVEAAAALSGANGQEARVLERMIERGVNAPLTSSLGRLFDAVAAVVLKRRVVDYEAQAAIELEGIAVDEPYDESGYAMEFVGGDCASHLAVRMKTAPLWQELVSDLRAGTSRAKISARFHSGVAASFVQASKSARETTGIEQVALSGGCLHNRRLARLLRMKLEAEGFEVFQHVKVSPGDGGLSYGQLAVAAAILAKRSELLE
ncbi:MAG: carbamoyltransferase HypF [Terracidiphilus sp.]